MKINFTVASFNVQNHNMRKNFDLKKEMNELAELVKLENIDVLCFQEVLEEDIKVLLEFLPGYSAVGKYRYGNNFLSKKISILKKYNEGVLVVSNKKILSSDNYKLPWFPRKVRDIENGLFKYRSLTPRIMTEASIVFDGNVVIKIFNTHLDKKIKAVQKRQLRYILKKLKTIDNFILLGDFNMNLSNVSFKKFVEKLKEYNLKRVEINTKTLQRSKKEDAVFDHVFVPKNFKVLNYKKIENNISDHYMIVVDLQIDM